MKNFFLFDLMKPRLSNVLLQQLSNEKDTRFDFRYKKKDKKPKKNLIKRKQNIIVPKTKISKKNSNSNSNSNPQSMQGDRQVTHKVQLSENQKMEKLKQKNRNFYDLMTHNQESEESKEIAILEKKLKLSKNLDRNFKQDGLDFLLGDDFKVGDSENENDHQDLDLGPDEPIDEMDSSASEFEHSDHDIEMLSEAVAETGDEMESEDDSLDGDANSHSASDDDEDEIEEEKEEPVIKQKTKSTVAIYGQDAPKYIAPHLRNKASNQTEAYTRLKRSCKGLLNRLADASIQSIVTGVTAFLSTSSRHGNHD